MDPKKLQGIDPKLQDAYNRIMATPTAKPAPAAAPAGAPTTPQTQPPVQTQQPQQANTQAAQQPMTPPPLPTLTPIGPSKNDVATAKAAGTPAPAPVGMIAKSGGSGISPVILIVAAVIFFLVYTLFFVKLFNVSVPFLP